MLRFLNQILAFPIYVWLLGLYPLLHLYSENLGLVIDHEVLIVLGFVQGGTTIAYFSINVVLRDRFKTASLVGIALVSFSLSGHIYGLLVEPTAEHLEVALTFWTLFVLAGSIAILYLANRFAATDWLRGTTKTVNLITIVLLIAPTAAIVSDLSSSTVFTEAFSEAQAPAENNQATPKVMDSPSHPDIYYIIPDGYPSNRWLKETMNYDNSDFSNALAARGFAVVDHAQSNYAATLLSLASTLNVRYFTENDSSMRDLEYLRMSIADSEMARHILELGYTYVQLLSGYLLPSPLADINRDFTVNGPVDIQIDESDLASAIVGGIELGAKRTIEITSFYKQSFAELYLDTTLLRLLTPSLLSLWQTQPYQQYGLHSSRRFLDTVDDVPSIAAMPEATFTVVHLMKPHGPTVMDAQGNVVTSNWRPSHEDYFAEFEFVNAKFLEMIDSILSESEDPPVIIFQADHGTTYGLGTTSRGRQIHFDIYAAYYLPDTHSLTIPAPFTLVNTFPLIFNEIFGSDIAFHDDLLFEIPEGYDAPFVQIDVTDDFLRQN